MKILIAGSNGMLGQDLNNELADDHIVIAATSKIMDITNKKKVLKYVESIKPDVLINAAAYTDVDGCEVNVEKAYAVNRDGVENLTIACRENDIPLIHISTDYVFKGNSNTPRLENDELGPLSIYGKTKLEGERTIMKNHDKYFILRTAWLYGYNGGNFPKTMLELSKNHDKINVVYDEIGSPTYTPDLAKGIAELLNSDKYGIYHLTNSDSTSWYDFAKLIFKIADIDVEVKPVTANEFARAAPRPSYSVLNNEKWKNNGFTPLRSYKDAIKEYIHLLKKEEN